MTVTPTPEPVDPTPEPAPEVTPEPETPSTGFSCTGDAGIPESDVCCEVGSCEQLQSPNDFLVGLSYYRLSKGAVHTPVDSMPPDKIGGRVVSCHHFS